LLRRAPIHRSLGQDRRRRRTVVTSGDTVEPDGPRDAGRAPAVRSSARTNAITAGILSAVLVYVLAGAFEAALIGLLHPTELELTWVSDVVVSAAFGVAVYLWAHLRSTRRELSERERAELVMQTQLSLAASMQQRLLPQVPAPAHGFDWAARLVPAGRIGGDLYDFVEQAPGVWMVLVADVSGKGVPAAMALGVLRSTFRRLGRDVTSPAQLVGQLSEGLYAEWAGAPYVTCIVARVDTGARTLVATNAGHPAALLLQNPHDRALDAGGPPVGLLPGAVYVEDRIDLKAGDRCVFVTDGVTEALENGGGSPRATIAATAKQPFSSTGALCDAIMNRALHGSGPTGVADWSDDRTVVAFTVEA
jgi:serine phosphatase RsbU (regulator of sigma subunit)